MIPCVHPSDEKRPSAQAHCMIMSNSNSTSEAVEILESLPLNAVLHRKFQAAERAGQVLDLTESSTVAAAREVNNPYATPLLRRRARQVLDLTSSAESTVAVARKVNVYSAPLFHRQKRASTRPLLNSRNESAISTNEVTPSQFAQPMEGRMARGVAMATTPNPGITSESLCRQCGARGDEVMDWLQLCSDCYYGASDNEQPAAVGTGANQTTTQESTIGRTPATSSLLRATQRAFSPLRRTTQGAVMPMARGNPLKPQTACTRSRPPTPTFMDDREIHGMRAAELAMVTSPTSSKVWFCASCRARVRDSWMKYCSDCYKTSEADQGPPFFAGILGGTVSTGTTTTTPPLPELSATQTSEDDSVRQSPSSPCDQPFCLSCHCSLRHAWMSWCRRCYEMGVEDSERFRHGRCDDD